MAKAECTAFAAVADERALAMEALAECTTLAVVAGRHVAGPALGPPGGECTALDAVADGVALARHAGCTALAAVGAADVALNAGCTALDAVGAADVAPADEEGAEAAGEAEAPSTERTSRSVGRREVAAEASAAMAAVSPIGGRVAGEAG